jgi:hypothetical protein
MNSRVYSLLENAADLQKIGGRGKMDPQNYNYGNEYSINPSI